MFGVVVANIEALTEECIHFHKMLQALPSPPTHEKGSVLPPVDLSGLDLHRAFRIGCFGSETEARNAPANAWTRRESPVDYLELSRFVQPDQKLYVATSFAPGKNPPPELYIAGDSNGSCRTWVDGVLVAEIPAMDFGPSTHRYPPFIHQKVPTAPHEILVEITPIPGKPLDFQLMVSDGARKFPVPYYTLTA